MGKIKTLGLLAVASLAIAAFIGTASASAETAGLFTASAGKGQQLTTTTTENHVFTVTGSEVECGKITFKGETEGSETESQTVTPTYEECKAFGFNATVNTAGCKYKFTATTDANEHAIVHLEGCTAGGITLTVNVPFIAKCKVFVKNQTVGGIHYTNTATDIDVEVTSTGIHAEVTESTGLCPLSVGTHTNATYKGATTVKAASGTIQHSKL